MSGASVAVLVEGEPVVDIWGGFVDEARTRPWERDTLTNVWSTTKTMTFLCALDARRPGRARLPRSGGPRTGPSSPQEGRRRVEVRHLMAHTAGLSGWTEPQSSLRTWPTGRSARRCWRPRSPGGSRAPRRGTTPSRRDTSSARWCRRITGVSSAPGSPARWPDPWAPTSTSVCPASEDRRVSLVIPPPPIGACAEADPGSIAMRTFTNPAARRGHGHRGMVAPGRDTRRQRARATPARSPPSSRSSPVAVRHGGSGFCLERGCDVVFEEQSTARTSCSACPCASAWGTGWRASCMPMGPRACFWGGYGGSLIVMDQDAGLTVVLHHEQDGERSDRRPPRRQCGPRRCHGLGRERRLTGFGSRQAT